MVAFIGNETFCAIIIDINYVGLLGGLFLKLCGHRADLSLMETGFPNVFFLVLIAPIIYESAYNTNKVRAKVGHNADV